MEVEYFDSKNANTNTVRAICSQIDESYQFVHSFIRNTFTFHDKEQIKQREVTLMSFW